MFWGYSLAFSRDAGPFIGSLSAFGMKNVLAAPSPSANVLPEIVYCLYQLLFCACTVCPDWHSHLELTTRYVYQILTRYPWQRS